MPISLNRRDCLAAIGLLAVGAGARPCAASADGAAASLAVLERRAGGRLGVYSFDLTTGWTLAYRADERFKMQSTFKGLLAAMVLHRVAARQERLDALVRFSRADLMPVSPVTTANVAAGTMSVGALCAAIMTYSDNAAANLLLRRVGGPGALTGFLRGIGDRTTRADNYEGAALATAPLPADSTTPRAITETLHSLLTGSVLPERERRQWEAWMAGNTVGRSRLRAAFPADWRSGDRTGTADGVCNDFAFARRPGQKPLLIAAYYAAPGMELTAKEAVLRDVGRIVVEWQRQRAGMPLVRGCTSHPWPVAKRLWDRLPNPLFLQRPACDFVCLAGVTSTVRTR